MALQSFVSQVNRSCDHYVRMIVLFWKLRASTIEFLQKIPHLRRNLLVSGSHFPITGRLVANRSWSRISKHPIAFLVVRIHKLLPFLKPSSADIGPFLFMRQFISKRSHLLLGGSDFIDLIQLPFALLTKVILFFNGNITTPEIF
jgi:hypothetical protein